MAHLLSAADNGETDCYLLPVSDPVILTPDEAEPVKRWRPGETPRAPILVPRLGGAHMLMAPPDLDVLVGAPLVAGTSILEDRDELRVGSRRFRYLLRDVVYPSRLETFRSAEQALCPIDMQPILKGEQCVYCPRCGYAMHPECITPELSECLVCQCPIAHTEEQAVQIAAAKGGTQ